MRQRGMTRIDAKEPWAEVVRRGFEKRVHWLVLADRDGYQVAVQIAYRRAPAGPKAEPAPEPLRGWHVVEVGATYGGYAMAAQHLGAIVGAEGIDATWNDWSRKHHWQGTDGSSVLGPIGCPTIVAASIGHWQLATVARCCMQTARRPKARHIVVDAVNEGAARDEA